MKNKLKAIIIDDELSARKNLQYLIDKHCQEIEIVGQSDRVITAVEQIKKLNPNLVFLDIEMPKQNGFELFKYFDELNFHVVFVTAYNHYAVKAFEVSAVDYLLKPIDVERLLEAERKVLKQTRYNANLTVLKENIETPELRNIAIPYKSDFAIIKIENLICIQAKRTYSTLTVVEEGKKENRIFTYAKKLIYFEENLPKKQFIRTHRSWIINLNFVETYSKKDSIITLKNRQEIPLSKTYKEMFEKLFL